MSSDNNIEIDDNESDKSFEMLPHDEEEIDVDKLMASMQTEFESPYREDDDQELESEEPTTTSSAIKKMENEVLTHEELEAEMNEAISDVEAILQQKTGVCRILLHKYKWNKESLLERFYEHPDTNAFLMDAQAVPRQMIHPPLKHGECDICCKNTKLTGLACNHRACNSCWKSYLTSKIVDENQCVIQCMTADCELLFQNKQIYKYITDGAVLSNYRDLILKSYVETNRFLRWCPGVDCQKAVKVNHYEPREVICSCGQRFCFSCRNDWHDPIIINCRLFSLWSEKSAAYVLKMRHLSEALRKAQPVTESTKECPKCKVKIEKNGGCNQMTCTSCGYIFCWMCLEKWGKRNHDSYWQCEKFNEMIIEKEKQRLLKLDGNATCETPDKRFRHFHHRYLNHQTKLTHEENLFTTLKSRIEKSLETELCSLEVKFLRKAVDVLSECRRTLMFTYAFAFFLKQDNKLMIFENNLKDLALKTELLADFFEQDLEKEKNLMILKQKVQEKCRYLEERRKIILDHCVEGAEQDFWVFTE